MIYFLMHIFKQSQHHSIYWAIEDARAAEPALGQPVAYCYITGDANSITDDIAWWTLEA